MTTLQTVANRIYVLDWWWNRATEDQAIDRVHRFGQDREVSYGKICEEKGAKGVPRQVIVYRFLVKNSIEGKMKKLQAKKTAVVNASLGSEGVPGSAFEDFEAIFADD